MPGEEVMNMDIHEALSYVEDGHTIIHVETAQEVCQAMGVPFDQALVKTWYSDPPGTPKGLIMYPEHEGSVGVYSLTLARYVAEKLGVVEEAGSYIGRGSQARAYARAIEKKLGGRTSAS